MLTTTLTDFAKDVNKYVTRVSDDAETLIVNKGNDDGVVVMPLDEYNAIMATVHELRSTKNQQRLDAAIRKMENGASFHKDLLQP